MKIATRQPNLPPNAAGQDCRFFASGRCRRGTACAFRHDAATATTAAAATKKKKKKKKKKPPPELQLCGPNELCEKLGAALLSQWSGQGMHRAHTHNFHARKAVMNPQAVSQLLELLPEGGVLDPFAGSGATLIEAMLAGRAAHGYDISPLAVGIARGHCWRPVLAQLQTLRDAVAAVVVALAEAEGDAAAASDWESGNSEQEEQVWDRAHRFVSEQVRGCTDAAVSEALWFLLSHEELYSWPAWRRWRPLSWRFERTAARYEEQLLSLVAAVPEGTPQARVQLADACGDATAVAVAAEGLAGVVTSPPSPAVFNYVADDSHACTRGGLAALVLSQHQQQQRQLCSGSVAHADVAHELRALELGSIEQRERLLSSTASTPAAAAAVAGSCSDDNSSAVEEQAAGEGDAFTAKWQLGTEAWLETVTASLRDGGRIAMLIGDNASIDVLDSVTRASATISARLLEKGARYGLRLLASASVVEDSRRPWGSEKKRNYRREHTILLERVAHSAGGGGDDDDMMRAATAVGDVPE